MSVLRRVRLGVHSAFGEDECGGYKAGGFGSQESWAEAYGDHSAAAGEIDFGLVPASFGADEKGNGRPPLTPSPDIWRPPTP